MLGKQWLRTYERTGQIGSHEKQALLRTRKWLRLETWGLRAVVEALPTILLVSVGLFFLALADYLWTKQSPVAIVVISFMAVGTALYGFMVIAAAIDKYCPFQTIVSTLVRETGRRVGEYAQKLPLWIWTQTHARWTRIDTSDASPLDPTVWNKVSGWLLSFQASAKQIWRSVSVTQDNVLPMSRQEGTLHSTEDESRDEVVEDTDHVQEEGIDQVELAPSTAETHDERSGGVSIWGRVAQMFSKATAHETEHQVAKPASKSIRHSLVFTGISALWLWMIQKFIADHELPAHSIHWMLEHATDKEDLLVTADKIPSLTYLEATRLVTLGHSFSRLLELFKVALASAMANETQDNQSALRYGKAVVHVVLAAPEQCKDMVKRTLDETRVESMWPAYYQALRIQPELHTICVALFALTHGNEVTLSESAELQPFHFATGAAFQNMQLGHVRHSTVLAFTGLFKLSTFGAPGELLEKGIPHSDALLSLVCTEIVDLLKGARRPMDQRVRDLWTAFNGGSVMELMTATLHEHDLQITKGEIRKTVLKLHTRLLLAFRHLHMVSVQSDHLGRHAFLQAVTSLKKTHPFP
ncbi:hypothetical protein FRB93_007085 [Tulasnella sp. JGI-2019a]|nr:hypothetical protein FRB93_007085 [Tulasnella sp. JGI-2019a]